MRSLARTSLGLLGLALIAPITAVAQDVAPTAPAGYQPYVAAPTSAPTRAPAGLDGQAMPAPAPPAAAPAPHQHRGRTLCAACAAKMAGAMPPGKIVGCAHSRNGVCSACQAALNMPGQFVVMGGPAPTAEAPGRAVASSAPAGSGRNGPAPAFDNGVGDPMPVGVVQANFSQSAGPMGSQAAMAPQASPPGRAVAEVPPGRDPYLAKGSTSARPHILGHLFGWSGIGADRAEEKARRKAESHAMISYDSNGVPSTAVDELPASAVYGKKR